MRHVYLEDSWVLGVYPSAQMFAFELDAVLTPTHPATGALRRASSYDHRRARLVLCGPVHCALSGAPPALNNDGTRDVGNIDTWILDDSGPSVLSGDWGAAEVRAERVDLSLS